MESWTPDNIVDFVCYVMSGVPEPQNLHGVKNLLGMNGKEFVDVDKQQLTFMFGVLHGSLIHTARKTCRNDTFQRFTEKCLKRQADEKQEKELNDQKRLADAYYGYTLSIPNPPASQASLEKSPFTKEMDEQKVSWEGHITNPTILPLINEWIRNSKLDVELFVEQAPETTFRDFLQSCFTVRLLTEVRKRDMTVPQKRIIIELKCADRVTDNHIAQLLVYIGRDIGKRVEQKETRRGAVMCQTGSEMMDVAECGDVRFRAHLLEITFMPNQPPHVKTKTYRFILATASQVDEAEVKKMDFLFSTFFGIDDISIINPTGIPPILDAESEDSGNVPVQEPPAKRPHN